MYLIYEGLIILTMIILNAVFAAYEMALASIARGRLTYLVQTKTKGALEALMVPNWSRGVNGIFWWILWACS